MPYPISRPLQDEAPALIGYIDDWGIVLVSPSYAAGSYFFEGKASVLDEVGNSGFIDTQGHLVIPYSFKGLGRFHNGLCAMNGGYLDHSGGWFIEPRFLVGSAFSEGRAFASIDGETFGFINLDGDFVIEPQFQQCRSFNEGLAGVCRDNRWGYVDHHGNTIIPFVFEGPTATVFRGGLAGVRIDGICGYVDYQGRFVVKPQYEDVKPFCEGLAPVKRLGKWGLVDFEGRQVVDCKFDELGTLDGGMAPAKMDGTAGFISTDGSWNIHPQFEKCYGFFGSLAVVRFGKAFGYIRRSGQLIWQSEPGANVQSPPAPIV